MPANLKGFLRVGEAAEMLGVSNSTLRNWANSGRIRAHRHPINDYRLFDPSDLAELLQKARDSAPPVGRGRASGAAKKRRGRE